MCCVLLVAERQCPSVVIVLWLLVLVRFFFVQSASFRWFGAVFQRVWVGGRVHPRTDLAMTSQAVRFINHTLFHRMIVRVMPGHFLQWLFFDIFKFINVDSLYKLQITNTYTRTNSYSPNFSQRHKQTPTISFIVHRITTQHIIFITHIANTF